MWSQAFRLSSGQASVAGSNLKSHFESQGGFANHFATKISLKKAVVQKDSPTGQKLLVQILLPTNRCRFRPSPSQQLTVQTLPPASSCRFRPSHQLTVAGPDSPTGQHLPVQNLLPIISCRFRPSYQSSVPVQTLLLANSCRFRPSFQSTVAGSGPPTYQQLPG
ncbi:hypothetical protein PoB_003367300 [Plakobranchus ocellatus]|uniref:Uncharacterized protein n=1 Tax=Plakobranchus ocellatus TaxID=259542 RepID=A0AAV4AKW3_9GAST|nr:hypothetical protein PoB_003367300 [Plakobranchus ocellatus]